MFAAEQRPEHLPDAAGNAHPQAVQVNAPGGGVIGGKLVAPGVIRLDDAAGVCCQHLFNFCQRSLAVGACPVAGLQLLPGGQPQAGKACLFGGVHLPQGDGVHAAAEHQQPGVQLRGLDHAAVRKPQQLRQKGGKACAACQHRGCSILEQLSPGGFQICGGCSVIHQNSGLVRCRLAGAQVLCGDLSLQMDQLCHLGTAHRFEGVDAEGAFVHRHTVDVVDAFFCGASDLREGRQKG